MIKNLTEKLNKICDLPRIKRNEVSLILKECYNQGKKEEKERIIKLIKEKGLHLGYANNIIDEINNGNITTR